MNITKVNQEYELAFEYSQKNINLFIEASGDNNPIHWDKDYAKNTPFKKPIMHGFIGGAVFSKVFGTMFPGEGTIYTNQSLTFHAPMFVETKYNAKFTVLEINKNKAVIKTEIFDTNNGTLTISGEASLINKERIFLEDL